jgi:hypothetical protein
MQVRISLQLRFSPLAIPGIMGILLFFVTIAYGIP